MINPWLKFYPTDWRADPALRSCSLASRGLWMEMICLMHEATPRGSLVINGSALSIGQIANLAGVPVKQAAACLSDLEAAGVFSRDLDGTIYSRRLRREEEKAERDKANGKLGGNPKLAERVNPQDKAQKLEARNQKLERKKDAADAALTDPEKDLFIRGKQILGLQAGGLIRQLLRAKNNDIALARAALETASTKQDAREYVGRIVRGRNEKSEAIHWQSGIPGIV